MKLSIFRLLLTTSIVAGAIAALSSNALAKQITSADGYYTTSKNYIVRLSDPAVAGYKGGIIGLKSTATRDNFKTNNRTGTQKLNLKSAASVQYMSYLTKSQDNFVAKAEKSLSSKLNIVARYKVVLDGLNVVLTSHQADQLQHLPGVLSVTVAPVAKADTDRGPLLINAPAAWDGTATGVSAKGEGMIVGIIDTGIRSDHPSFAATDPVDGYVHTNPLGSGTYLGYCATNADFCNDKLIGAYNFADGVTDPTDENEHGTHVASTAAGNHISFDLGGGNAMNISGVAPRANIIAYRIADSSGTSSGGASTSAIEQAVTDGVDVINYSFGGDAFNPWNASDAIAFRNARAAGVIVATSAGNSGPDPETIGSPADAPWLTSAAASTHDRGDFPTKNLSNMSGGDTTPPTSISGRSLTSTITAPIVYAGNFSNGDTNPEQCLNPFPANTFNGEIVVCDRGSIARVEKAQNVAAGGAGGYVLANLQGGATFLADDLYVVPGIHINANDGDTLKSWLATGSGHTATITATNGPVGVNAAAADSIAGFSSRGNNPTAPDIIKPSVSAPGVAIFAASLAPVDYAFLQGTSMASPHVAGAMLLVKQLQPSWTAGQIHSALMTTAVTLMTKEDGITAADPFDMGGGRVDINAAVNAGLLMDETDANFTAADPANGGSPKTLNLPGLADSQCSVSCSWTRTVSAAVDGDWTASYVTDGGLSLSVVPESFSLNAGQSQSLTITADISGNDGEWLFGRIVLTPANSAVTTTHLTVATKVNNSTMPDNIAKTTQRDSGQFSLTGITSITAPTLAVTGYMKEATINRKNLAADSDNTSAFDDVTDGVSFELVTVNQGDKALFAETSNSTATDLDLYIGRDQNGNGQPDEFELSKKSTSADANEAITIQNPVAGSYWILVQNWDGAASGTDGYDYVSGVVTGTASTSINASTAASSDGTTPFDINVNFSNVSDINAKYVGVIALGSGAGTNDLGESLFTLSRDTDDVSLSATPASVTPGDNVSITIDIAPATSENRNYTITVGIPSGMTVDANSLADGATMNGNNVEWVKTVSGSSVSNAFTAAVGDALANQTVTISADHTVDMANASSETASTSISVGATASGGGTGGGTGSSGDSSSSSGGGGSIPLIGLLFTLVVMGRRRFF